MPPNSNYAQLERKDNCDSLTVLIYKSSNETFDQCSKFYLSLVVDCSSKPLNEPTKCKLYLLNCLLKKGSSVQTIWGFLHVLPPALYIYIF